VESKENAIICILYTGGSRGVLTRTTEAIYRPIVDVIIEEDWKHWTQVIPEVDHFMALL